jgi:hypothetical protein
MARWLQIIAVLAMVALAANSQCDARCLASLCQAGGCHHSSQDGNAGCHYWQSNLAGTEASPDLAKIPVAPLLATAVQLPACSFVSTFGREYPPPLERGSPPGEFSVLRI